MPRKTLEDILPSMATASRDILGHTITYRPAGATTALTIKAQGDYSPNMLSGTASVGIDQDIELMILKSDIPAKPVANDRITLPRVPGIIFQPVNVTHDETAQHWIVNLKKCG
jgi:hypothetical protein